MAWPEGIPNWLKNVWGLISGDVASRMTTAQIIDSLRPYAAAQPGGFGPKGVIYVSQLRSAAVQIRSAADAIAKAEMKGTITAEMIRDAPWARSAIQQSLDPQYAIRALVEYTNPEFLAGLKGVPEKLTQWITHYTSRLPARLEQLVQRVTSRASEAGSPPTPVTGVARMEILAE